MANAHALLSRGRWHGVGLAELVYCELAPCMGDGNATVLGPHVILAVEATQALAMVFHELVTNAAKYGALSTPHGRVSVRWEWQPEEGPHRRLRVEWEETGGPKVVPPSGTGYGTKVICDIIPYELGGTVDLELASEGVRCRLELPQHCIGSCEPMNSGASGAGAAKVSPVFARRFDDQHVDRPGSSRYDRSYQ